MTKITQQEFKKWAEEFKGLYDQLAKNFGGFQNENEKEEFEKVSALICFYTGKGNLWGVTFGLLLFGHPTIKKDNKIAILGGLTIEEWDTKVSQRLREHCAANGYYKPNSPSTPASLKEREKKTKGLFKDKKLLYELLSYADKEDYDNLTNTINFIETAREMGIVKDDSQEEDDPAREAIWYGTLGFLVEDHIGRVEKLISKKEAAETKDKPSSPTNNSPNSPTPKPSTEYKNNLEAEIKRLQDQVSELEDKANKTDNTTQKETYRKILDNTKNDLADKKKEKDKLSNSEPKSTSPNGNSNKLNWAIGLGIAAVVISILGVILLLAGQKKKKKNSIKYNY